MKPLCKLALTALTLVSGLSASAANKKALYDTSFEKFNVAKITEHQEGKVTWTSKGKFEVTSKYQKTGKQCLRLFGGKNNTLEIALTGDTQNFKALKFQAERWTAGGHFHFRILAQIDGSWKEISKLDNVIKPGARFRSNVIVKAPENVTITGLKLVCSAPENTGMLIDDFQLLSKIPVSYDRSTENYVSSEICAPEKPGLLPIPQSVTWGRKAIELTKVKVTLPSQIKDSLRADRLKTELAQVLKDNAITVYENAKQQITFKLAEVDVPEYWKGQEKEAYALNADETGVLITAKTVTGLYYGLQTLRQLTVRKDGKTTVAACKIQDFPAFKIRGFMHDVGRNFQTIEQLKMQIDVMAAHKLNIFHFHVTEYHGWRFESKIYPKLQDLSTFKRKPGKFYTQKEFVALVDYCWARNITIIPEFDTPGHSDALMKALNIKKMSNPKAIKAVTELITEICSLVPVEKMPYFHVGTDEARKKHQRVGKDYLPTLHKAVQDAGRQVIGWSQGMTFKGAKQISQTWAKSNPFRGTKHIDSRSNYVNHMESLDFASRMFFQQPCRVAYGNETQIGGILCHWPDTKVDDQKLTLTNNPIIPAMVAYSEAVWKGVEKNHQAYWAKLPAKGTKEFDAYADFENRIIQQRDRFLTHTPFTMVKTYNIEWRLFGPVADGEVPELDKSILKDSYTINGQSRKWSNPVYGGAIHAKHFFAFSSHYGRMPKGKDVVWGNANIYSPVDQEVDAWINFNTISTSDDRAGSALAGDWNKNKKCNIWINGERIEAPKWKNPGVLGKEIALIDNVYSSRKPTKIKLKKGWNTVLMKSAPTWKWVFSFSPVEKNANAYREVKDLFFSSTPDDRKLAPFMPNIVVAPRVVAVPPADAGRGLIRVNEKEIRHYPGKGGRHMLQSLDNGETWKVQRITDSYPSATCLGKESPAIAQNPVTKEYIRFEPLYRNKADGIRVTKGGIDGEWSLVKDDKGNTQRPGGILRNPLWVNDNKRIIIPGHGGGCYTWNSDDQGQTWTKSNVIQAPHHKPGGVHKGTRWNHGMVEATVIELNDKRLWLVARTAQDQHYESFSTDFGTTWSKAQPSRFWGTITMPTFHRLKDGRMLFLWSNTTALPEKASASGRGEDVFTNRDTIHAAISEDDGKTWNGFRELILDEHRDRGNYGTFRGSQDRGKHQAEVVQLDDNRVLYSCGQHAMHRRLMILDLRWLYQKERQSDIAKDGAKDWTTHQFINKKVGHCAYNRTPGSLVKDGAIRLLRLEATNLTNPNQGATWNFPAGDSGKLTTKIRLEKDAAGLQIALCDRWFSSSDPTVDQFANYVLKIDAQGKTAEGKQILTPGKVHTLSFNWSNVAKNGTATLTIDGQDSGIELPCKTRTPNGISYVHFYNTATETDSHGASILSTQAQVK